jgi:hypothetical protein
MTLYELLRKLVNGERIYDEDKANANALIDRLEQLNAFGSTALYVGEHECESDNKPVHISDSPSWQNEPPWRGPKYWNLPSHQATHCKFCGREME